MQIELFVEAPWPSGQGLKVSTPRSGVQSPDNANFTGRGLGFNSRRRRIMQKIRENAYKRSSALAQGVPSGMDLIGLLSVMQSGVNLHKAGRIVGCNIIYVIFLIICNSIINETKKKTTHYVGPNIIYVNRTYSPLVIKSYWLSSIFNFQRFKFFYCSCPKKTFTIYTLFVTLNLMQW